MMGFSNKFVPTPRTTTKRVTVLEASEILERDLSLKVYCAGGDILEPSKSKLYVKSIFRPPQPPLKLTPVYRLLN